MDTCPHRIAQSRPTLPSQRVEINWAIVDRLTFGGNIIETGTDSYRLAQTRAAQQN